MRTTDTFAALEKNAADIAAEVERVFRGIARGDLSEATDLYARALFWCGEHVAEKLVAMEAERASERDADPMVAFVSGFVAEAREQARCA